MTNIKLTDKELSEVIYYLNDYMDNIRFIVDRVYDNFSERDKKELRRAYTKTINHARINAGKEPIMIGGRYNERRTNKTN